MSFSLLGLCWSHSVYFNLILSKKQFHFIQCDISRKERKEKKEISFKYLFLKSKLRADALLHRFEINTEILTDSESNREIRKLRIGDRFLLKWSVILNLGNPLKKKRKENRWEKRRKKKRNEEEIDGIVTMLICENESKWNVIEIRLLMN